MPFLGTARAADRRVGRTTKIWVVRLSGTENYHKEITVYPQYVTAGHNGLPKNVRILLQKWTRFAHDLCDT